MNRWCLAGNRAYVQHPCAGHRLCYCPNGRDRLNSRMIPAQSTFLAQRKGFACSRAGLPNLTECPLARNSDRAERSTQAASNSLTSTPHQSRIPEQVPNPNLPDHTAESHEHWRRANMAAQERRQKREKGIFGIERRAQSPASAAGRICCEIKTSVITQISGLCALLSFYKSLSTDFTTEGSCDLKWSCDHKN